MRIKAAIAVVLLAPSLIQAAELGECVSISDDVVRLFCYDRAAGRQVAPPSPAAAAPGGPAVVTPVVETEVEIKKPDAAPKHEAETKSKNRVEAHIVGRFEGWSKGTRFKLDNGQTWEAVGAGTHYSVAESPAVVIERDFIGQTLMSVEGIKARAIVRRVTEP